MKTTLTIHTEKGSRPLSCVTQRTLDQIPTAQQPLSTFHAMGSWPNRYRTFGNNVQTATYEEASVDRLFRPEYVLCLITSSVIIRKKLYPQSTSCHTLYCDKMFEILLSRYQLKDKGIWDCIDSHTLEEAINFENVDHRMYYSICKPFAIRQEIRRECLRAEEGSRAPNPILFVDSDLILKQPHDRMLKNPEGIEAAFGHIETTGSDIYPSFESLHFPDGYQLDPSYPQDLPAVNTCLMYFNNFNLAKEWSDLFAELMMHNWIDGPVDATTISRQLLGFDQRTFPMVAAKHGLWGQGNDYWSRGKLEAFLDLEWTGEKLIDSKTRENRQWHYYTLEYRPEKGDWMQDITHTWINKRDIELDKKYQGFQCCVMLEIILGLCPQLQEALRTIAPMKPYFDLLDTGWTIEELQEQGIISNKLTKQV